VGVRARWAPSSNSVRFLTLGDNALTVEFGQVVDDAINQGVHELARRLMAGGIAGLLELVPAYSSLAVHFDPLVTSHQTIAAVVAQELVTPFVLSEEGRPVIEIPMIYGGEFGPDLEFVASYNGLSPEEVIRLHSGSTYRVFMIGFAPGFPYLGPLPLQIVAPRLPAPRDAVPAGSVGIAGSQTGIYPLSIAGGVASHRTLPATTFRLAA